MDVRQTLAAEALPRILRHHIEAYRTHDLDALMATMADGALVNDIRREFLGHAAIRAWAEAEIIAPKVTLEVAAAFEHLGDPIVRFRVDGDFDKTNLPNPLVLTYYFAIREGRIAQLIILHNTAIAA